jgi:23S rRNA (guanine2445-N2)-methyltransferase / 23S rRNA (guanine2069-N7)-methyltransferase
VAAAAGGAKGVVAQDSSSDRLAALRDVLAANNCADGCRFERSDVRSWLAREASKRAALDLIVMAPPTWLPARDGGGRDWDLQRDHLELLGDASRLLAPGGALVLVWTEGTLRIDRSALDELGLVVEDVSARIVPHDFERARQAPRCYLVRRRQHGQAKR